MTADEIIGLLGLAPHPEGGHFRETYRDLSGGGTRGHSTLIYFLLQHGEVSRWHRVDAAEAWHWYAGAPLELSTAASGAPVESRILGPDLASGARPQIVVQPGEWQRARSLGSWTLVGCSVAPGFTFAGFELAHDDDEPGVGSASHDE